VPEAKIVAQEEDINRLFESDRLEDIYAVLESGGGVWGAETLATLRTKSPQTMKVSLRLLKEGRQMVDFAAEMAQEYAVGSRVVARHDFLEGVRAVIVDKDNAPVWNPDTPEGVTDELIDAIFASLPKEEAWTPA
jgi:enoyl-CoA hydratase